MYYMIAASFILTVILIPIIIKFCKKFGLYDSQDERKIHTGNIPRLGGIGIIVSFIICVTLYFLFFTDMKNLNQVLPIIFAGLIIFIFALLDDFFTFKPIFKLIFQIISTVIILAYGFRFKQICNYVLPLWLSYTITFFWMIGIINAYNLIDGLDALCGGLSALVIGSLGIILNYGNQSTSTICFIMVASITGFLVYNKPKAKIFMGDGGSQFMGFMIASLPLYYSTPNFEYNKFLVMIVLVSIPMLDTIAAMWRRTREHRSFLSPDSRHIHHKLISLGFTKVQTLIFLISIQVFLCLAAGLGMFLRKDKGALFLISIFIFMIIFYSSLHFIYYTVSKNDSNLKLKD